MAVTVSFFNKFIEHVGKANINLLSDTFKIKLVNNYTFDATDENLADIGSVEISNGNGYTTGGASLSNITWAFNTSYTKWDADDVTWTASGGTIGVADGAILYDDTASGDKLVCYIDFGQDESAGDGTDFKITFNSNGIFRIS